MGREESDCAGGLSDTTEGDDQASDVSGGDVVGASPARRPSGLRHVAAAGDGSLSVISVAGAGPSNVEAEAEPEGAQADTPKDVLKSTIV